MSHDGFVILECRLGGKNRQSSLAPPFSKREGRGDLKLFPKQSVWCLTLIRYKNNRER